MITIISDVDRQEAIFLRLLARQDTSTIVLNPEYTAIFLSLAHRVWHTDNYIFYTDNYIFL